MPGVTFRGRDRALGRRGAHRRHQERCQHQHRVGQVDHDDGRRQGELDRDGAEEDLDHQQHEGERRGIPQAWVVPVPEPRHDPHRRDREGDEGGHPAMADLDEGREVEGGEPLPVAVGPMFAATEPRPCDADDPTQDDQQEGERGTGPGQPS